jgi:hypothetical protein
MSFFNYKNKSQIQSNQWFTFSKAYLRHLRRQTTKYLLRDLKKKNFFIEPLDTLGLFIRKTLQKMLAFFKVFTEIDNFKKSKWRKNSKIFFKNN